tara:strand:+ start:757 stop:1251 length:495 start_codon:yes stop_codon:yes gene_type:complete
MSNSTQMIAVKEQPFSEVKTYGLRHVFKLNGFRWFFKHKLWAISIDRQAEAVALLESMKLTDQLDLVEMSIDELCSHPKKNFEDFSFVKESVLSHAVTALGVELNELNKLINANKIRVRSFQTDSIGRKINKRLSTADVIREFPELDGLLDGEATLTQPLFLDD